MIWSGQNWNRENKKKIYEDRPFKEGDKVLYLSRIKKAEGRTKLISSFFLNKINAPNMKDIKNKILFAKY